MKKYLFCAIIAAAMCSCSTISHTASTQDVQTEIMNVSTANLEVSNTKISYTFTPTAAYRRAGDKAVRRAAIAKALEANGNADILVAPEFEVKKTRGLFTTKIKYVTVKGYPAKYKNIHATTQGEANIINTLNGGCAGAACRK